jgi:hypothetical protein
MPVGKLSSYPNKSINLLNLYLFGQISTNFPLSIFCILLIYTQFTTHYDYATYFEKKRKQSPTSRHHSNTTKIFFPEIPFRQPISTISYLYCKTL